MKLATYKPNHFCLLPIITIPTIPCSLPMLNTDSIRLHGLPHVPQAEGHQFRLDIPILVWGNLMDTNRIINTKASRTLMCRIYVKNYMQGSCRVVFSKLEISPDRLTMAQEIDIDAFSLQVISWNLE